MKIYSPPTPQTLNLKKIKKKLYHNVGKAITDFKLIEDGDKIMVCLSGGADSYTMLDILMHMKAVAPINFDIIAVNLDQKQPGFPEEVLPNYLYTIGVEYQIVQEDTYSIVKEKIPEGATTCSLCSRLRRGILYKVANKLGVTKIALGHHADDIVETLFLNMFYGGRLKSMPPKLISDDKKNIVIRPLAYCREKDIKMFSEFMKHPIIPCNLCGSQENLQRKNIKQMLTDWEKQQPDRVNNIFRATKHITPSHLLDRNLFNFDEVDSNYKPSLDEIEIEVN